MGKETISRHCFRELQAGTSGRCPHCGYDPAQDEGKYPLALPYGTILNGRFLTGRVLGQGGFGITYIARDWEGRHQVAIKEYLPEMLAVRTGGKYVCAVSGRQGDSFQYGMQCFLKEAQTLAEFRENSEIVRVHSYFEENGTAYFVMDYVDGISFQKYIQNHGGKISWQDTQRFLFPIMDALEAVHSKGIIHRDVTPDNIFITEDGMAKLLDFGAARYSLGDQSRSLDVVLKHGFAPKEQYTRHGRQGPYTDVYAVAATFYYAVTGRRPPDSIDRLEEDSLMLPDRLGVCLPEAVEKAVARGLSVQPQDRYQSMSEFKRELSGRAAEKTQMMELPVRYQKQKKRLYPAKIGWAVAAALVLSVLKSASLPDVFSAYTDLKASADDKGASSDRKEDAAKDPDASCYAEGCAMRNIAEDGMAAEDDNYSYYTTVGGLLRVEKDTGGVEILDKSFANNLNLYDGWIYYIVSGIVFRVPADGSKDPQKVLEGEREYRSMYIADGTIYLTYENDTDCFTLLRAGMDQWKTSKIVSGISLNDYTICGGWVYFRDAEDNSFYKIRADGAGKRKRLSRMYLSSPVIFDGWIYAYTLENSICRLAIDGSSKKTVCKNPFSSNISGMNIKDGRLYFYNSYQADEKGSVGAVNLDGTDFQQLYTAEKAGDYFYGLNFLENEIVAGYCKERRLVGTVTVNMTTGKQITY